MTTSLSSSQDKRIFNMMSSSSPANVVAHATTSPTPSIDASSSSTSDAEYDHAVLSSKCKVCNNNFNKPKVLPCLHTFCLTCLEVRQTIVGPLVVCPTCSAENSISSYDLGDLSPDYAIMNMLLRETLEGVRGTSCPSCKKGEVVELMTFCIDCGNLVCDVCKMAHESMHSLRSHRMMSVRDLRTNSIGSRFLQCEIHKKMALEYFCCHPTCNGPRCRECLLQCSTSNHEYYYLEEVIASKAEEMKRMTETAQSKEAILRATFNNIKNSLQSLQNQYDRANDEIDRVYEYYAYQILERKHELKRQLEKAYSDKRVILNIENEKVRNTLSNTRVVQNFFRKLEANTSQLEMLTYKQMLESKMKPVLEFTPTIISPNSFSVSFINEKSIIQAAVQNSFGYIRQSDNESLSPRSFIQDGPDVNEIQLSLAAHQLRLTQQIPPSLLTSFTQEQLEIALARICPPTPGLSINNDASSDGCDQWQGSGNGGDIFSKVDMFHVAPNESNGTRVNTAALNSPRSSVVTRNKMVYYLKFGEFGSGDGQFTEPSGVAVAPNGDIVVADANNHRVQVFDRNGEFKLNIGGECGKRDGQLLYPNRVAVCRITNDVIVTERSPTHQVQIFAQDGRFLRKFGSSVLQHPRGVTVDYQGRIVVVECKVMRVIIFDHYGNIVTKFSCQGHLEFPNGIVVNKKEQVFISDNRSHCVKVFSYGGDFIRTIGGEGVTNFPIGVGINNRGEILVADNHNNFNVTIFTQEGQLLSALESRVKHAQCFDVTLGEEGTVVLASKDFRIYIYRYTSGERSPISSSSQQNLLQNWS